MRKSLLTLGECVYSVLMKLFYASLLNGGFAYIWAINEAQVKELLKQAGIAFGRIEREPINPHIVFNSGPI